MFTDADVVLGSVFPFFRISKKQKTTIFFVLFLLSVSAYIYTQSNLIFVDGHLLFAWGCIAFVSV